MAPPAQPHEQPHGQPNDDSCDDTFDDTFGDFRGDDARPLHDRKFILFSLGLAGVVLLLAAVSISVVILAAP